MYLFLCHSVSPLVSLPFRVCGVFLPSLMINLGLNQSFFFMFPFVFRMLWIVPHWNSSNHSRHHVSMVGLIN